MANWLHWAYIAGFLDGDGYVRIASRKTGYLKFEIVFTNTDKPLLEAIQIKMRCGHIHDNRSNEGRFAKKTVWKLMVTNREDCIRIGKRLLPYLYIKKEKLEHLILKAEESLKSEPLRRLTKAQLTRLYWDKRMGTGKIAKKYGVIQAAVMARLRKFNIPTRRKGTNRFNIDERYPKR